MFSLRKSAFRGLHLMCACLALLAFSCASPHTEPQPVGVVTERVPAPCGLYEAVVTKLSPRGSEDMMVQVFFVLNGRKPQEGMVFFRAKQVEGLKLIWVSDQSLLIRYSSAWVTFFWSKPELMAKSDEYCVEVQLAPRNLVPTSTVQRLISEARQRSDRAIP